MIKFRAWDKENKIMLAVNNICNLFWDSKFIEGYELVPDPKGNREYDLIDHIIDFADAILMQSTGLFDKNGQEIFEGDVVEFEDADDIENVYINQGVIEWCQGGFIVTNRTSVTMGDLLDGNNLEVTVIGNIYENPELLFKDLPEDDRQLTDFPTCPVCDERTYSEDTCPFWSSEWSVDRARI